jgi:hypothetical protein
LSFESFGPAQTDYWFGMREALLPNLGILDGIPSADNYDPLLPARYLDLIDAVDSATPEVQQRLLRLMGVGALITERERPDLAPVYANSDVVFSAIPEPLPRGYIVFSARSAVDSVETLRLMTDPAFDPTQDVVLESSSSLPLRANPSPIPFQPVTLTSTLNTITIRAVLPEDGYLVILDTYYPGWQALVDEQPATIYPANLAFRAVPLAPGEHRVEFRYQPVTFQVGAAVTSLTWLLLFGFFAVRIKRLLK